MGFWPFLFQLLFSCVWHKLTENSNDLPFILPGIPPKNDMAYIKTIKRKKGTTYKAEVRIKGHSPLSQTFDRLSDAQRWAEDKGPGNNFGQCIAGGLFKVESERNYPSAGRCLSGQTVAKCWAINASERSGSVVPSVYDCQDGMGFGNKQSSRGNQKTGEALWQITTFE